MTTLQNKLQHIYVNTVGNPESKVQNGCYMKKKPQSQSRNQQVIYLKMPNGEKSELWV